MKKLSILSCFIALLLFALLAFRTTTKTKSPVLHASSPVICLPGTTINAVPFVLEKTLPQTLMIRKNVYSLTTAEINSIKAGISAMKALPYNNPTSWTYQAAIHGTYLTNNLPSWNSCQHHTRFFFSWHRMYLYFFERILRAKSGNPSLTLPYWDYQTNAAIPPSYRDNTSGNPLYDGTRYSSMNSGGSLPSSISTAINNSLTDLYFYDYQAELEGPHGSVHTSIGGNMGSVPTAAQDPVFFLHHSNIDRLWEVWLRMDQGRTSPNSSDSTWWNQRYTFFDETGRAVVMTGSQIVSIASQLNYAYDNPAPPSGGGGPTTAPGRIEAENYSAMSGVIVSNTADGGGGKFVGWIDGGDWMDYPVNIATAGTYRFNVRVASAATGAGPLQLRNSSGTVLVSVNIPNTGGWDTYTTVSTTVTLPAGQQTLRIYAYRGGWNINWFEILTNTSGRVMMSGEVQRKTYELIKLPTVVRLNQKMTEVSFTSAKTEALQSYLRTTNNNHFDFTNKEDPDKLYTEVEVLKINKKPEGVVEVYLNLPNNTTPSPNSIYFVGVLDLFTPSAHAHHNENNNLITLDANIAATAQGLTPKDLSKAKLTFYVRGNKLPNGSEVNTSSDVQIGNIKFVFRKAQK